MNTISYNLKNDLTTLKIDAIKRIDFYESESWSTFSPSSKERSKKYLKIRMIGVSNIRFKVHKKHLDREEDKVKHELYNENLEAALEILTELENVDYLNESQYKRYLKKIENILCEYNNWLSNEMDVKTGQIIENLETKKIGQESSEILESIQGLLQLAEQ